MIKAVRQHYTPNLVVLLRPDDQAEEITKLAPFTEHQKSLNGKATAYVCRNYACNLPTTDVAEMEKLMKRID
jgi:uncharacterized protein YyaL (SSP411 family)